MITRQIDILAHIVINSAIGDSGLIRQDIAAELRAVLQVDPAVFGQIDTGAFTGVDNRAVLCCVAVLGKFRAVGEVQGHTGRKIDRAALVGIAAADYGTVFDVQGAVCRLHVHRAAVARSRAVTDGGFGPPALLQGERHVSAVDRAAGADRAACCGAVFKARAGDSHVGFIYTALAVQRAAVIGGGTVPESAIDYFDRLSLGVYGPAEVIAGICAGGAATRKGGVFDGCFFSVARRFVVSIHVSVIDCAAVRRGTAILERAVFHTQLRGSGFNRAAMGQGGVPIRHTILKCAVFEC